MQGAGNKPRAFPIAFRRAIGYHVAGVDCVKILLGKEAAKAIEAMDAKRKQLIKDAISGIPIDDIETPEDTAAHIQAMKEYKAGETIAFEDVNWS